MFLLEAGLCILINRSIGLPEAATGLGGLCLTWGQTEPRGPGQQWLDRVAQEGCGV